MNTYQKNKEKVRNFAIKWQSEFGDHNYSLGELASFENYFEKMGRRYGLIKEFKAECII